MRGKFRAELVSNRQEQVKRAIARRLAGYEPHWGGKHFGRLDMYWITFQPEGTTDWTQQVTWAVDLTGDERGFYLNLQHGQSNPDLDRIAAIWFRHSPYYQQMVKWLRSIDQMSKQLETAEWETCSLCNAKYRKGTKHQHFANKYHFGIYRGSEVAEEMESKGIEPDWGPGYGRKSGTPPLEEVFTSEQIEHMSKDIEYREKMLKVKQYGPDYKRKPVVPLALPP